MDWEAAITDFSKLGVVLRYERNVGSHLLFFLFYFVRDWRSTDNGGVLFFIQELGLNLRNKNAVHGCISTG